MYTLQSFINISEENWDLSLHTKTTTDDLFKLRRHVLKIHKIYDVNYLTIYEIDIFRYLCLFLLRKIEKSVGCQLMVVCCDCCCICVLWPLDDNNVSCLYSQRVS